MSYPTFDDRDQALLDERQARREEIEGPRLGDFILMPDGRTMRFSYDWGDEIQISKGGSWYLYGWTSSFSGGLEPSIDKSLIEDTGETMPGRFWFFHHNRAEAHNGVEFEIPCRVYRYLGGFIPPVNKRIDPFTGPLPPRYVGAS